MNLDWYQLQFPNGLESGPITDLLRTIAGESRSRLFHRRPPVVIETLLSSSGVTWRLGATSQTATRLKHASDSLVPGLSWTEDKRSVFDAAVAVETRVVSPDRLMAADLAEASSRRVLGIMRELGREEIVLVQWQIGSWMVRSPIPPATSKLPPWTLWNIGKWGEPERDSEQIAAARAKASEHIFACVGRIAVAGAEGARAHQLITAVAGGFQLLRAPGVGVSRRAVPSFMARRRLNRFHVPAIEPPCRLTAWSIWPIRSALSSPASTVRTPPPASPTI